MALNDKLINFGNLAHFKEKLDEEKLSAGQNISIKNDTINAKGYFYDDEPKEELKPIDDILVEAGMPAGQSLGLKVSGAAGATTYTFTDDMGGAFAFLIQAGMLPGVGATYQTANGKSGVIASIGNDTITFEETLDADNALTNEPVDYVVNTTQLFSFSEGIYDYVESDVSSYEITLSGAAGATTYTYSSGGPSPASFYNNGAIFKLQDNRSAKIISLDETNQTVTFESTFDADNALSGALVTSIACKNIASGKYSHAEGGMIVGTVTFTNTASGGGSHAEGGRTTASGIASHAEGHGTAAQNRNEHAEGSYNISHKVSDTYGDSGNTIHSIGIGNTYNQKNAFEVMQNGDMYILGVGGYQGTDTKVQDATIKTLQEYIASLEARIAALENPTT